MGRVLGHQQRGHRAATGAHHDALCHRQMIHQGNSGLRTLQPPDSSLPQVTTYRHALNLSTPARPVSTASTNTKPLLPEQEAARAPADSTPNRIRSLFLICAQALGHPWLYFPVDAHARISYLWKSIYPSANSRIVAAISPVRCCRSKPRPRGARRVLPTAAPAQTSPRTVTTSKVRLSL